MGLVSRRREAMPKRDGSHRTQEGEGLGGNEAV